MLQYFKKLIKSIIRFINHTQISPEEKTRLQQYSVFLAAGIPLMMFYGLYNAIYVKNYLLFSLILISASGLVAGWFLIWYLKKGKIIYRINTFIFTLLILYLALIGGDGGSKLLWMYTFPLISFFLFGKNEGMFWSITVLLISIILFWNPFDWADVYDYPKQFEIRFAITFFIVSVVTYWFEYFRYHYRINVELKTQILQQKIIERKKAEKEKETLILGLQNALNHVKKLSGLLPLCSHCKKVRDDKGYWNQIDSYIEEHSEVDISHSICPECAEKYYPDMDLYGDDQS